MTGIATITLEGVVDTHVHVGPSPFERPWDDTETARDAAAKGMHGLVLKSHFESTASRAYHTRREVPEIKVFGGIVLNRYIGGINPVAVEVALIMGAKMVWMPTIDSAHHVDVYGSTATYQLQGEHLGARMTTEGRHLVSKEGLSILDRKGNLKEEVTAIVDLVAEYGATISTCHLYQKEILLLVKYAQRAGAQVLITHPYQLLPDLTLEDLQGLVKLGATIEFTAATCFPPDLRPERSVEYVKESIESLGVENVVIASDGGSSLYGPPTAVLRMFLQWLESLGVGLDALRMMVVENPKKLLQI